VDIILDSIQIKRGAKSNLPVLKTGEPAYCTDTKEFALGTSAGPVFIGFQAVSDLITEITNARGGYSNLLSKLNALVISGGGSNGVLVFQTLVDLQTAYPNGTTQPAWIVADNAWYYWSGTVVSDTTAPTLTITTGGTFTGSKTVTLSANETATIYYTLDGTTPTTASAIYLSALSITATTTLKAFAKDTAGNSSAIQTVTYTLGATDTTVPIVTASPAAGNYTSAQTVVLSANETATIYYTLDGTTPTTASTVYNGPISISATKTLQFIGKDSAGNTSAPVAATYTINAPADTTAPVLTITPAATFTDTQTVTMSTNETATIWYTLDDTDPITSGTKLQYTTPLTLTATDTIKAYAVDSANNASAVQTVTYTKQAAPTVYAADTFNRADTTTGNLGTMDTGQTWSSTSTFLRIVSNQLKNTAATAAEIRVDAAHSDVIAKMTVAGFTGTTGQNTLIFRAVDVNNSLWLMTDHSDNKVKLYKKVAGTLTLIQASAVQNLTMPYTLKVVANGSNITCYLNDVALITVTETTYQTATIYGINQWSGNGVLDDFWVGPIA
jgi:hypothetical protein